MVFLRDLKIFIILQSLCLASSLIKFIWTNASTAMDSLPLASNLSNKFRGRPRTRVVEPSSSENSVSVEASHSEDEMQIVRPDSSDDESLSGAESGKSDDQENVQINSGGYVETHSDSDADEERSGNEDNASSEKKPRRRVLRRKKNQSTKPVLARNKEGK